MNRRLVKDLLSGQLSAMEKAWAGSEIDLIVADYFALLGSELAAEVVNKAARNRALRQLLPRNCGSIEFKHQNISAVMLGRGQPWIEGYKPAANFQNALVDCVLRWLDTHPDWLRPTAQQATSRVREASALWIGPRPAQRNEPPPIDPVFMAAMGRKYDVAERDARNRALGKAGEELVLAHECQISRRAGREDLADRVRWTAVQDGDSFGSDIASFEPDGRDRLIEVKTTNGWERTPFHITQNEMAVADARREERQPVRLWNFARQPSAFALRPRLEPHSELTPTSFLASLL